MIDRARELARSRLPDPVVERLRAVKRRVAPPAAAELEGLARLSDREFVRLAYWFLLERAPDAVGEPDRLAALASGTSRTELLRELAESPEFAGRAPSTGLVSLHSSRMQWIRSLPRAERILDLGGASLSSDEGALVQLGYPYPFELLTIVDLPPDDRHELYRSAPVSGPVETRLGPVEYRYHSMAELDGIADGSVDLVVSGQTFEHVTPADGRRVLAEVRRVLRPGGHLALDTPNGAVTAIQLRDEPGDFIDPDHEVEYTHPQMLALFAEAGLTVVRCHGLNLVAGSVADDRFHPDELVANPGLYDDIERCYLLAYVASDQQVD